MLQTSVVLKIDRKKMCLTQTTRYRVKARQHNNRLKPRMTTQQKTEVKKYTRTMQMKE